jgi:topoisomerase-4 subunit B
MAVRDGESKLVEFAQGKLKKDHKVIKSTERNGTLIEFIPDEALFGADFKSARNSSKTCSGTTRS